MSTEQNIVENIDADIEAQLSVLDDLEIEEIEAEAETDTVEDVTEEVVAEAAAEPEIAASSDLDEDMERELVADLSLEEAKGEAYEEQESASTVDLEPAAPKAAKAPKTPRAPKAPGAPRARKSMSDLKPEDVLLSVDDVEAFDADPVAYKASVIARAPAQKKVQEKFENALVALSADRLPSNYTVDLFKVLVDKGEVTSTELVKTLMATEVKVGVTKGSGYNEGTARSQTGQIMALFPALKIATRNGQKLTFNKDSLLAEKLTKLLAA